MPIVKQRVICLEVSSIHENNILINRCSAPYLTLEEALLIQERIAATVEFARNNDIGKLNDEALIQIMQAQEDHVNSVIKRIEAFVGDNQRNSCGQKTKIYVMIDRNTGYYKIGRSDKPTKRERTLQSEKPTIELLFYWEASYSTELELHDMFAQYRVRGEWFNLSEADIEHIKFMAESPITYHNDTFI